MKQAWRSSEILRNFDCEEFA